MSRIGINESFQEILIKMSDGNPGALTSMISIIQEYEAIDPQAMMGGLGAVMLFDTWEIYGSSIYVLFNDKCDRDVRKLAIMLRACQMGHIPHTKLQRWAEDQSRQITISDEEWQDMENFVLENLEQFAR